MGVNRVDTASGEVIMDISDSTVTPETLAEGEKAYNAQGEPIVGTAKMGDEACNLVMISCTLDLSTMTVVSMSHNYAEIKAMLAEKKIVFVEATHGFGYAYGQISADNMKTNRLYFQVMVQNDFGDGVKLYYFTVRVNSSDNITLTPYIVNTTEMGG